MDTRVGEQEFLRPDEVARLLRCGRTKTYELLRTGEVPSYRVGRSRIVRRSDINVWLSEHQDEIGQPWSGIHR
jgi:excisionase family DNA binding protein